MPGVTKNLLIINIVIWLAMTLISPINNFLGQYGALYYFTSDNFLPTQLITYMFIHASFTHLFFNMLALFMFGVTMERVLGGAKFLFYYVSCGLGAALVQEGVFAIMIHHYASVFENAGSVTSLLRHSVVMNTDLIRIGVSPIEPTIQTIYNLYHTPTVGASGAIFGILLAFGFMFPNVRIYLLIPPIPMKAKVFVAVYALIELSLGIYNSQADTVAHFAHLGGMLFGLLILLYWRKKRIIGGPFY
ncbi:MAG: rhomboid family intramembrane serine protease [Bacteroidales bacterium]|nr:rhomboid family intramembrane serine protease [Bacteroidales bacterium]